MPLVVKLTGAIVTGAAVVLIRRGTLCDGVSASSVASPPMPPPSTGASVLQSNRPTMKFI